MKIRIVRNSRIPPLCGEWATTIYPFIFLKAGLSADQERIILSHEMIHVAQVERLGWLRFYTSYIVYYIKGRLKGLSHKDAYLAIPFEAEAYKGQLKD